MTCIERALVDSHFRGAIVPADEHRMRDHLVDCAACQTYYRKRQILADLDPAAPTVEDRLAVGLGLGEPAPAIRRRPRLFMLPAVVAVAAALFLFIRSPKPPAGDGFTARGQIVSSTTSSIGVYRVSDHALLSTDGGIRRDDELAFSYDNASAKPYLMIFGVDEGGRVYWFYPAWTNESENPMAVKTDPGRVTQQLPEAIKHPFAGRQLTVHGLFLDTPLTVRDVETAVRDQRLGGTPGAVDQTLTLEVSK